MNKLIKQLAEQFGLQPYYDAQEGQIERFAELIINECAGIDFYERLRSSCNKEQAEELADLISSAIRTIGVTE